MAKIDDLQLLRARLSGWTRPPWVLALLFVGDLLELAGSVALAAVSPAPAAPPTPGPAFDVPHVVPAPTLGVAFMGWRWGTRPQPQRSTAPRRRGSCTIIPVDGFVAVTDSAGTSGSHATRARATRTSSGPRPAPSPVSLRTGPRQGYQGKTMAKVHWRDVPLCRGRRASEAVAVGPDDPTRVTLLREHRRSGRMADGWVCTPDDLWLLEGHEAAVVLPGPEEIDWTGFPD